MSIKFNFLKHPILNIVGLIFIAIFMALGYWQLSRANQKKIIVANYNERKQQNPLMAADLNQKKDFRFYRAALKGVFDNTHTFLLDNKTFHGQIGYEIYTPFKAQGLSLPILIDRGFIAIEKNRSILPTITPIIGTISITGLLNLPPTYVTLGRMQDSLEINWPLRIEFINLEEMAKILNPTGQRFYPYILTLNPDQPGSYPLEWKIVTVGPERHLGYAVQWFAIALTLLILWFALNKA